MSIKTIYNVDRDRPPALVPCSFIFHDTGPWQLLDICQIMWPLRFENWFFSLCSFYVTLSLIHANNRIVGLMEWPVECWDTSLVFRLQEQEQRRFTLHVLATSHVFPETLKKTTSELDISRMFKLRTGARLCSGRGAQYLSEAILAPLLIPYLPTLCPSLTPGSCSDLIGGAIDTKRFEQKQSCGWVLTNPLNATPLRPDSTFIDGFSWTIHQKIADFNSYRLRYQSVYKYGAGTQWRSV